jgi:hypothetical protein
MTHQTLNRLDQQFEKLSEVMICLVVTLASLNGIIALGLLSAVGV